ncbi:glycosyltransferase [Paenibacillus pedocola]|uniref:glycosyltransferase n=1 Tax=Paenibacillus pedocola TaxID=3242193 RepID=UPI0028774CC5|nr:glycosyltransferase family A protein [Paenibacillus typhae]
MINLLQGITVILLLQLLFAVWNAAQLPKLGSGPRGKTPSKMQPMADMQVQTVSVLVPARDEAEGIAACLSSVLDCSPPAGWQAEILVLDDRSSDGTGEIAVAAGADRVRVLPGLELPAGWLGKSHACAQLAEAAGGEWLLFLDADVRLRPGALQAALAAAEQQGSGLITGFPRQITGSWLERLVVPLMGFTIISHLPVVLVRGSEDPRFVAAHGGFMLIRRDSYARCGGHAAIRGELVDDMALARAVKHAGEPVLLADITEHAEMRMYHNAAEVWNGYRKNIYAGLGRRPSLLLGILLLYVLLYVLPYAAAGYFGLTGQGQGILWSVCACAAGIAVKRTSDSAGRHPLWFCFLIPASILSLSAIAVSSWRGSYSGRGYEWKGRKYR